MSASTPDLTATLDVLTGLCRTLTLLPLQEVRGDVERAQALGPILEPTAYRDGGSQNLKDQADLLDAAIALQAVVRRIGRSNA